jgi:hypothetical protein
MIRTCRDAFRTVEGSYIRKEKFKPVFNELGQVKEVISESPVSLQASYQGRQRISQGLIA